MFRNYGSNINNLTVIIWQYAMHARQERLVYVVSLYLEHSKKKICFLVNVEKLIQSLLEDSYRCISGLEEFSPSYIGRSFGVVDENANIQSAKYRKIVYNFLVLRLTKRLIGDSKIEFYKPFCVLVILGLVSLVLLDNKDFSLPVNYNKGRVMGVGTLAILCFAFIVSAICQKLQKCKVSWSLFEKIIDCIDSGEIAKTKLTTCCESKNIDDLEIMINKELQNYIERSELFIEDQLKSNDDAPYCLF